MMFKFNEDNPVRSYVAAFGYTMQAAEEIGIAPSPPYKDLTIKAGLVPIYEDWYRLIETKEKTSDIDVPAAELFRLVRFVGYELRRLSHILGIDEKPIERLDYYPNGLSRMYMVDILLEDIKLMDKIYRVLKPLPQS